MKGNLYNKSQTPTPNAVGSFINPIYSGLLQKSPNKSYSLKQEGRLKATRNASRYTTKEASGQGALGQIKNESLIKLHGLFTFLTISVQK